MVDTTSDSMASIAFPSGPQAEAPAEIPLQYAPAARRLGADIMDFVIIGGVAIAAFFWAKPYLADDTNPLYAVGVFAIFFFNVVVPVLYHVIFLVTAGATPGKMAFRIKVVDEKGEEHITISRAFLREVVGKVASLLILGIGFLMPLWDAKRQALHDKIAHTVVVKAV